MVLTLALLAGLKIWAQDTLYKSATEEALVAAYRDRAVETCQKQRPKDPHGQPLATASGWSNPSSVKLVIGNDNVSVYIWQVDNALWSERYKRPYLVLAAADRRSSIACAFDITAGSAQLVRN
jgi:hypothetical protein